MSNTGDPAEKLPDFSEPCDNIFTAAIMEGTAIGAVWMKEERDSVGSQIRRKHCEEAASKLEESSKQSDVFLSLQLRHFWGLPEVPELSHYHLLTM